MSEKELRTIMAPLAEGYVLLPNSAVAEVLSFTAPEPFKDAPPWLMGELAWRGWQVPVISFEQMISDREGHTVSPRTRILVIKTLGESTQLNFIGLLIQGLPTLKKVTPESLLEEETEALPETVFSRVSVEDLHGWIPELGTLTQTVEKAAYGT